MSIVQAFVPCAAVLLIVVALNLCVDPRTHWARTLVVCGTLLLAVRYALWRVFGTLPAPAWSAEVAIGYAFFGLELLTLVLITRARGFLRFYRDRWPSIECQPDWYRGPPQVDLFIPTYNEGRRILERTLVGATALRYPKCRIWLLDDGNRAWVRQLAASFGVGYLARLDNRHFKSGNLNHGLQHVMRLSAPPEFIAVVDADFVPRSAFLEEALNVFADPRVGLVQTPQHFYNPDPFQHAFRSLGIWLEDQRYWFDTKLPALDHLNGAICCGTSFVVRASALLEVGGVPTDSLSEDVLLSFKLKACGYQTAYLNRPLSVGLSPEGLHEFMTQRTRWCHGVIQVILGNRTRGVRSWFKCYESALRAAIAGCFAWCWVLAPLLYWYAGIFVLNAEPREVLYYGLPLWLGRAAFAWLSRGAYLPVISDGTQLVESLAVVPATWRALTKPEAAAFKVTGKGVVGGGWIVHGWLCGVFLVPLLLLLVGALLHAPYATETDLLLACWTTFGALTLSVGMIPCLERPRFRTEERFRARHAVKLIVNGEERGAILEDISASGASFRLFGATVSKGDALRFEIPGVGWVPAHVVRLKRGAGVAVQFAAEAALQRAILRFVYVDSDLVRPPRRGQFIRCMMAILRFSVQTPIEGVLHSFTACRSRLSSTSKAAVVDGQTSQVGAARAAASDRGGNGEPLPQESQQ